MRPYLLSPSLPSNVKIKSIKTPGPDRQRSKTHQPDFDESCKRRTSIVKLGIILNMENNPIGKKKYPSSILEYTEVAAPNVTSIKYTKHW